MKYIAVTATCDSETSIFLPNCDTFKFLTDIEQYKLDLITFIRKHPETSYSMFPTKYGLMFASVPEFVGDFVDGVIPIDVNLTFKFVSFEALLNEVSNDESTPA